MDRRAPAPGGRGEGPRSPGRGVAGVAEGRRGDPRRPPPPVQHSEVYSVVAPPILVGAFEPTHPASARPPWRAPRQRTAVVSWLNPLRVARLHKEAKDQPPSVLREEGGCVLQSV